MKHCGTQTIETPRLLLRRFLPGDAAGMLQNWAADPQVQQEYGEPVYDTPEAAEGLLRSYLAGYAQPDYYRWAVILRSTEQNIGQIAFCKVWSDCATAEIEYCIGADFWGNGFAGEALAAVIQWTFAHTGFVKLEAYHRAANPKSGRVLQKSVMQRTETVERFRRAGKAPEGEICYAVTQYTVRAIRPDEYALLNDFLYEAVFVPQGTAPPPRDIILRSELQVYTEGFGAGKGDAAFVAEAGGRIVGAVWVRIMNDYGHIDDDTPSFAISLYPEYRGKHIGTALMKEMLKHLQQAGYRQASLSVQKENYAADMYRKLGFQTIDENEEEYIMVYRFPNGTDTAHKRTGV